MVLLLDPQDKSDRVSDILRYKRCQGVLDMLQTVVHVKSDLVLEVTNGKINLFASSVAFNQRQTGVSMGPQLAYWCNLTQAPILSVKRIANNHTVLSNADKITV